LRTVATAGHVDHGKSSLVLALTGTDPDRFPEEKARGLTIDLGFAFCTLPDGERVGFVDVPGHVQFVKNMLAGVGAVDVALLVVAANEGWMPQSEEHLRILDGLGVRHGLVVLTKADLVDDETLELGQLEVLEHLTGTTLAAAPVVTCDSRSGRGLDDVRAVLASVLAAAPPADDRGRPRLWVDRVFAAKGAGTVVTGTLAGGALGLDAEVLAGGLRARVRGIETAGTRLERAVPGTRVALNLAGIDHHALHRGDAVVLAGQWLDVTAIDVALAELPGERLARRSRCSAYLGSGEHTAWCRVLDDDHRFARLRLDAALPIAPGDRLVLRDPGRATTVAGAEVLDVAPGGRAADAPARLELPLGRRLLATGWVPVDGLAARAGCSGHHATALVEQAGGERIGRWLVDRVTAENLRVRVGARLDEHHRADPSSAGLSISALARELGIGNEALHALLVGAGDTVVERGVAHRAGHGGRTSDTPEGEAMVATLEADPFTPPQPTDLALARALVREGTLVEQDGVYFGARALERARALVVEALKGRASLSVADIRDLLGSTRKYVLPIVARLDATGVTRRRGDERIAGPTSGADPPT